LTGAFILAANWLVHIQSGYAKPVVRCMWLIMKPCKASSWKTEL